MDKASGRFNLTLLLALMLVAIIAALGITVTVQHVSVTQLVGTNEQLLSEKSLLKRLAETLSKRPFSSMIWRERRSMTTRYSGKKASAGWWLSGGWLKATTVPVSLCLMTQLSSCVRTEIQYVDTPPVPIPLALLADCPVPDIPEPFTWGDSLVLNESLLNSLANCNHDKAVIRKPNWNGNND